MQEGACGGGIAVRARSRTLADVFEKSEYKNKTTSVYRLSKTVSVTIQAQTPKTLTLKSNQGTKFGTLQMPMFSLFDLIIFFGLIGTERTKYLAHDF